MWTLVTPFSQAVFAMFRSEKIFSFEQDVSRETLESVSETIKGSVVLGTDSLFFMNKSTSSRFNAGTVPSGDVPISQGIKNFLFDISASGTMKNSLSALR